MHKKLLVQFIKLLVFREYKKKGIRLVGIKIPQPANSYYDGQTRECVMDVEEVLKLRN
jgi:hypothetical protein